MSTQGSITRDASGLWSFVVDVRGGDEKRRQLRRRGFKTKKAAQEALTAVLGDMHRGSFVRPTKTLFGDYLREWLKGLPSSGRRPSTIDSYRQNMERNVIPHLGGVELQAVRAGDLDSLYGQLLDRGLSMRSVRYVHTIIGKALSDAERKGMIARNPARSATPPALAATRAPEMTVWTAAQLREFLDGLVQHRHFPMLRLAAMSGLRRAELCGLRWTDVDLEAGTVSIRQSITAIGGRPVVGEVKTKRSRRVVDVDPVTVGVLRAWKKEQTEQWLLMGGGWVNSGLVFTMRPARVGTRTRSRKRSSAS